MLGWGCGADVAVGSGTEVFVGSGTEVLVGKGVEAALKKAGIQKFEPQKWDEMEEAIKAYAEFPNEVDPEPVISGNGSQPA